MHMSLFKHKQDQSDIKTSTIKVVAILLLLFAVGYLAYGLFFVPAIFMDDWTSVVERIVTNNAQWFDPAQRRPLLFSTFLIQNRLFGLNISAYYFSLWFLYVLMAVLLYAIVVNLPLAYKHLFGLVTAILFLIYPTNYTHMWLIMFGVYCGTVLTLLYGYLLLKFAQSGRWILYALALIFLLLPLGIYEGQIGLASTWALILFILYFRQNSLLKRVSLLVPILLMGIYAIWRTFGYQAAGVADQYLSQVATSPTVLLSRLLLGYKISLVWGWTSWPTAAFTWVSSAKIAILLLFAVIFVLLGLSWIASKMYYGRGQTGVDSWTRKQRQAMILPYVFTAVAGGVLVGAGYVPTLTVFLPSLSGIGSRFNIFATIGGAVFITAVFMIVTLTITGNLKQVKILFLAAITPFVLLGIFTQASVQYDNSVAWREQQTIWQELFTTAPDFADDTLILFILPGFENRTGFANWRRTPLSASWEASSGVRLLYNNSSLLADVYFPDIEEPIEPSLTDAGILTKDTGTLTPYSQVVAFVYDNESGKLRPLQQLPGDMIQGLETAVDLCDDCILQGTVSISDAPLRELVQD